MFGKFDKVFFLRSHKTAPKIIVTAVHGAFAARTVFKIVDVARLNYVAAMFALYNIPLDYAFHRQVCFEIIRHCRFWGMGLISYINSLIYGGEKSNGRVVV